MQHTTSNGHQWKPRKAATPTHHGAKVDVNRAAGAAARRVPAPACFPRGHSTLEHSMLRHAATAMQTAAMRTYAHARRVARTRCTHLHPRRTASMPRSPDALFASASLFASRIVRTSEGGRCRPRTAFSRDRPQPPALASSPAPTQATACCGRGVLNKTLVATPADEMRIADGLGVS